MTVNLHFFLTHIYRYRWLQADRLSSDQQLLPPQQDGLPDDIRRWLQCLLGLFCQLPGNTRGSAWEHRLCPPHGQNRAAQHAGYDVIWSTLVFFAGCSMTWPVRSLTCSRGLYGAVWHQLLLPVVWNQRVHDDFHALSLQRPQYLCLELSGRGHHRAVPDRQEVGSHVCVDPTVEQKALVC